MAQGPGYLERFLFSVLVPKPARAEPSSWSCSGGGVRATHSVPRVTIRVTHSPSCCSCRADSSLLSPQGCLLQCWLCAQPGACRECQVVAEFLHRLDIPGECQRGREHCSTIRGQPQHPEPQVRDPQPFLGVLGGAEVWGLPQDVQRGSQRDLWCLRSKHQIKEGSHCHARISETPDESHYIKNMLQAGKYPLMYSLEII